MTMEHLGVVERQDISNARMFVENRLIDSIHAAMDAWRHGKEEALTVARQEAVEWSIVLSSLH